MRTPQIIPIACGGDSIMALWPCESATGSSDERKVNIETITRSTALSQFQQTDRLIMQEFCSSCSCSELTGCRSCRTDIEKGRVKRVLQKWNSIHANPYGKLIFAPVLLLVLCCWGGVVFSQTVFPQKCSMFQNDRCSSLNFLDKKSKFCNILGR